MGFNRRPDLDIDHIARLYADGESEIGIARILNANRWTIHRRIESAGLTRRSQSKAEAIKWSRMTPEQRARQVAAAHDAARGRKASIEERSRNAATRQRKLSNVSGTERLLATMLAERGISTTPQLAIGPYNCDLAAAPVAVEVWGGGWHWSGDHAALFPERTSYLMDAGWDVLCLETSRQFPLAPAGADYIATYIEERRRNPTAAREYRVVRGAGELMACGSANDDQIALIRTHASRHNPTTGRYERIPR